MPHREMPTEMGEEDRRPRVSFAFHDHKIPESMTGLELGEEVVVSVRGTVCGLRDDEYGSAVDVKYSEFALMDDKHVPKTLSRALEELEMKRRRR